jgi:hypothetical protein
MIRLQDKVTEKWYQFGVALGVEKEVLDRYLNYPPEQSIVEILDHWLRIKERNWRDVAKALRQFEHHQLAKEIESIDKTGNDLLLAMVIITNNIKLNVEVYTMSCRSTKSFIPNHGMSI